MAAVEFAPDVVEAQKKIKDAYPHMTERQVSFLSGYLTAVADRREEEEQRERAEQPT